MKRIKKAAGSIFFVGLILLTVYSLLAQIDNPMNNTAEKIQNNMYTSR